MPASLFRGRSRRLAAFLLPPRKSFGGEPFDEGGRRVFEHKDFASRLGVALGADDADDLRSLGLPAAEFVDQALFIRRKRRNNSGARRVESPLATAGF